MSSGVLRVKLCILCVLMFNLVGGGDAFLLKYHSLVVIQTVEGDEDYP